MKMSVAKLKKMRACVGGVDFFREHKYTTVENAIAGILASGCPQKYTWSIWLISKCLSHKKSVLWACFAARDCLCHFERLYPLDNRPRAAIEAAENWVKKPTAQKADTTRAARAEVAAADAAWTAWAAGAAGAAWAADAADAAGAARTVWAADAAGAAWAEVAAAGAAARADAYTRIIDHGIALLAKQEAKK